MQATFEYPKYLRGVWRDDAATQLPHVWSEPRRHQQHSWGTEATIVVSRNGCWLIPNSKSATPQTWENDKAMQPMNAPHWQNFVECIQSRNKRASDIETCVRSSTVCILANLSMRSAHLHRRQDRGHFDERPCHRRRLGRPGEALGRSRVPGRGLIGADQPTDIAVVRIDAKEIRPLPLGRIPTRWTWAIGSWR